MFELAPAVGVGGQYQVAKSLRFNSADNAYLSKTFSTGNRQIWTWSSWVKRSALGTAQKVFVSAQPASNTDAVYLEISFGATDKLQVSGATTFWRETTAVYRDVSAWYHIVVVCDTTNATANNRFKLFVNGQEVTSFSTINNPTQNANLGINVAQQHSIGARPQLAPPEPINGYLTEIIFVDGQALTADSFGKIDSTTGQWIPKKYTGSYGTNGFYLPFNDGTSTTTLGYDRSGNSNNWTLNNFSVAPGSDYDWFDDSPTNNFATLNPLSAGTGSTTTNGNLYGDTGTLGFLRGNVYVPVGKWYWEVIPASSSSSAQRYVGITDQDNTYTLYYWLSGSKEINGTTTSYGASYVAGDVIGVALDMDNLQVTFYKNNVSQGAISITPTGGVTQSIAQGGAVAANGNFNFGQRPFAYTPPAGFKPLSSKNLPTPTVKNGKKYFNPVAWVGNGASGRSVTGVGFSPNLVWVKNRTASVSHVLYDTNRGTGPNAEISTSNTSPQGGGNNDTQDYLSSFDIDGFTSTWSGLNSQPYFNTNGQAFVAWNWKESPIAGFDIVSYAGTGALQNVNHNLGVAPSMIIVKNLTGTYNWPVWHTGFGNATDYIFLNLTNAKASAAAYWNNTLPTSSSFTVNTSADVNANGNNFIAYLFAEVPGFSKIGKYTGNGSTNGPFVHCGFKPAFVMVKRTDAVSNWVIVDTSRDTYNVGAARVWANLTNTESTANPWIDFLSNGFKVRDTSPDTNASGSTYIFMAFAEAPFKYSNAR